MNDSAATAATGLQDTLGPFGPLTELFGASGAPVMAVLALLSVATVALFLVKLVRFLAAGAFGTAGKAERLVAAAETLRAPLRGERTRARGPAGRVVAAALEPVERSDAGLSASEALRRAAREEGERVARAEIRGLERGLGALSLIATLSPLLGLLGTVLGMIEAFRALEAAGSRVDPAALSGGIWTALLTTAAGLTVAILASLAHGALDSVVSRVAGTLEDLLARLGRRLQPETLRAEGPTLALVDEEGPTLGSPRL